MIVIMIIFEKKLLFLLFVLKVFLTFIKEEKIIRTYILLFFPLQCWLSFITTCSDFTVVHINLHKKFIGASKKFTIKKNRKFFK